MRTLVTVIFLAISSMSSAQDRYMQGMTKGMELWGEQKTAEASNLFERIAMAEPDNWLPFYYVAMVNTTASFGEQDEKVLTLQLEKARDFAAMAKTASPGNPEILVLEAMINTAWIAFDGATYGMTLSGKVTKLYQEAMQLAPENPRVIFSKAQWEMGSARYFGKDTAPYCEDVKKAVELFTMAEASEVPFYPNWGEDRAREVLLQCK